MPVVGQRRLVPHSSLGMKIPFDIGVCVDDSGQVPYGQGLSKPKAVHGIRVSRSHLPGTRRCPLILRRSARARRISLRISQLDGRVTLTMPKRLAEREALDFARRKKHGFASIWIARGDDVMSLAASAVGGDASRSCRARAACADPRRRIAVPGAEAGWVRV